MSSERYNKFYNFIKENEKRYTIFKVIYKLATRLIVLGYFLLLCYVIMEDKENIIKVVAVPGATFLLCSILRHFVDRKRPYEVLDITPLIPKEKKGHSFPSRHVVSAAIISMTGWYVSPLIGSIFLCICVIVSVMRVLAGVHYISDVLGGIIFAVICGGIGFWVI